MSEIKLKTFMNECLVELAKRFNVDMTMDPNHELKIDVLNPTRYLFASNALLRMAPDADPKLFEINGDISPTHFATMIGACLGVNGENPKDLEYFALCTSYLATARNLTAMCFDIFDGMEPVEALRKMDAVVEVKSLAEDLGQVGAEALALSKMQERLSWLELMLDPPYLVIAASAIEGLPPKQAKSVLQTACTAVSVLPERPDPDSFRVILRNTRERILTCTTTK